MHYMSYIETLFKEGLNKKVKYFQLRECLNRPALGDVGGYIISLYPRKN